MVDGRVGAGGRCVLVMAAILGVGCLTRQHIDDEAASSETSTSEPETTTGGSTMDPELMTTTETPESTASPTCDDGEHNQSESDVDCGGPCPACDPGEACEDNDDCVTQACAAGVCVMPACFVDDECAGLADACTAGRCGPDFTCVAVPDHEDAPCDDGSLCSVASSCVAGACTATEMVDCTAFDSECTAGLCDASSGACLPLDKPDGAACDDDDGCTPDTTCQTGACVAASPGALLFEDFSGDASGWLKDGMWAIGPAAASTDGIGGADPAQDHSASADNRLAGVAIGKLDQTVSHTKWCLTSPAVDVSDIGPGLHVSFWRHLHAPPQPKVIHTVEVWNGATWTILETGYAALVDDAAWTFMSYNASGIKAVDFKLRLCSERLVAAPDFAGWSVDDVTIAPIPCTP